MGTFQLWITAGLALGAVAVPGDVSPQRAFRPASEWAARSIADRRPHAVGAIYPNSLSDFELFGWVSPPVESTTATRIAEYAGAGLNLLLPAWADSGRRDDNLVRLDCAAAVGAKCLVWDRRFESFLVTDVNSPAGGALLDSIVSDYVAHPGFAGYYLGDEPPTSEFPLLGKLHAALRARDPQHPAWNNLLPIGAAGGLTPWRQMVADYFDSTQAAVLCYDEYDFQVSGDRQLFVQHLANASAIAEARQIPFWTIVQLIQHLAYRALTDGEMRWQVSHALAYHAAGIGYFTYWTPAPDPTYHWQYGMIQWDGQRSPWYAFLAQFNPRVSVTGRLLYTLHHRSTLHAGSVPNGGVAFAPDSWVAGVEGRCAIGEFDGYAGARYLLIANSDSAASQTLALSCPSADAIEQMSDDGQMWTPLDTTHALAGTRAALSLAAGDFAVLRLSGLAAPVRGSGPGLALHPNPAHDRVELAFGAVRSGGAIEIYDASGRLAARRSAPTGWSGWSWDGTLDRGGTARPGVYLARLRDAGGATTLHFSWIGR